MITKEDVLKIQEELTEEQMKQLVYYISKDHLLELRDLAREKVKYKFIAKMRWYITRFINELSVDNVKNESINLFKQTRKTLNSVYKLIDNNDVVDANSLLRLAFELLIMAMMINESIEVYNEFIDLSIDDSTRNYTKPQKLRNNFRKVLKKLDGDYFVELSNRNLKDMLDDFYDKLCMFTHGSLIMNAIIEMEKDDSLNVFVIALKQNTYFVEFLLYLCLKYLRNYKKEPLDLTYAVIGMYILISDVPKDKYSPEKLEKFYSVLYKDKNKKYFNKYNEDVNYLINESQKLREDVLNNPLGIIEILEKIIN